MYDALDVARYIILKCREREIPISNLKLQKILYFVQALFLRDIGLPCFLEDIEAWQYGPVVPNIYREFKSNGSTNILDIIIGDNLLNKSSNISRHMKLIDSAIDDCSSFSALDLVNITHQQDPWKNAYHSENNVITHESLRTYFSNEN